MLDKMYDNAVAEVMSRCANDLQNQVALVGEVSDGIERLQDRALAYVSRSPTFEDADEDVKRQAAKFVVDDLFQLGPIEELLWDPEVSEIMVNSPDQVMVERRGKITLSDVHFFDEEHVQRTIARIVSSDGRRCDNQSPLCDCMLHRTGAPFDGSRVNAVAFGIAKHWTLDVRKFRNDALTPESLIANGSMDENMADFLQALVLARMNIVIEGGTGSGKTTLLNALSNFIPDGQRIITVEDTAELNLAKSHVLSLQSRPANNEGKGEITLQQLVINTLRQRPDRIVVGECRGPEAFDMLQAMNSGHDGSLTTTHANNPRAALDRLQNLVQMSRAGANMPPRCHHEDHHRGRRLRGRDQASPRRQPPRQQHLRGLRHAGQCAYRRLHHEVPENRHRFQRAHQGRVPPHRFAHRLRGPQGALLFQRSRDQVQLVR